MWSIYKGTVQRGESHLGARWRWVSWCYWELLSELRGLQLLNLNDICLTSTGRQAACLFSVQCRISECNLEQGYVLVYDVPAPPICFYLHDSFQKIKLCRIFTSISGSCKESYFK